MKSSLFSRSEGAGRATTRKTRGLTRSVIALMVPPFPAPSRPSKRRTTFSPLYLTHSWSLHSSAWSLSNSFRYLFPLSSSSSSLPPLAVLAMERHWGPHPPGASSRMNTARRPSERLAGAEVEADGLLGHRQVQGDVGPGLPVLHDPQPDATGEARMLEER